MILQTAIISKNTALPLLSRNYLFIDSYMIKSNATYLFNKPCSHFNNAEHWWNAYFSMLVLWLNSQGRPLSLPVYSVGENWGPADTGNKLSFEAATYSNFVAGCGAKPQWFEIENWPTGNNLSQLSPDISFKNDKGKEYVFIECKKISQRSAESAKDQLDKYNKLAEIAKKHKDYSSKVYCLVSRGYWDKYWQIMKEKNVGVLLWEDVLHAAKNTPFEQLLGTWLDKHINGQLVNDIEP